MRAVQTKYSLQFYLNYFNLGNNPADHSVLPAGLNDQSASSTTASTSTATPSGSEGTPTAARAWRPASPNTSTNRSEAPLTTLGWSVKSADELTKPPRRTMRRTFSRPPAALIWAMMLIAHWRAAL